MGLIYQRAGDRLSQSSPKQQLREAIAVRDHLVFE
jgi:hypothetical protein